MSLHEPAGYPFAFRAEQQIELSGYSLTIRLSVTNTSNDPIPAGLAFHPVSPARCPDAFAVSVRLVLAGRAGVYADRPDPDFDTAREVPAKWRANCYTGWRGSAVITQPSMGYVVTMDAADQFGDLMF